MQIIFDKEIKEALVLDKEKIAKDVYLDIEDEENYSELSRMIDEAYEVALPKACVTKLKVRLGEENQVYLNDVLFTSKVLVKNINESVDTYGVVCTCGVEIEKWAQGYRDDPLLNYYADAIMVEVLGAAVVFTSTYLSSLSEYSISHASPGSTADLPLSNQEKLFEAIGNVKEKTGVFLTPEFLMKPLKSVSGIYFANDSDYTDCKLCTKVNCPRRREPYDDSMFKEFYS